MTKKTRTDSTAGATATMQGAMNEILPPDWVNVPEGALNFWRSITKARAADKWNDADLESAAELARTKYNIERLNIELRKEKDIVLNGQGSPMVNPKHKLLETLTRRMVVLSRVLQVHAEATQGKSRDQVKANRAQQEAEKMMDDLDDLIARPSKH
jgi:hypothetical protein